MSPAPQPAAPLRRFTVTQDGTLHFTLHARDLDHAHAQIADLECTEAAADVTLADGVHLTHITHGTVHDYSIEPADDATLVQLAEPNPRSTTQVADLYRMARRDAEDFLAGHPLPDQPAPLPDLTPHLQALPAARTPAEVSAITHQLVGATAPVLDHIASHFIALALWAGTEHQHTPQSGRLLREAAQGIRTALTKMAQADLENLRAYYAPTGTQADQASSAPSAPPAPENSGRLSAKRR
ncbi:hypothetical protein [Streptomyces leeuwenhoekii]|uniref:hypothetical protein n=2 Tax=Streptomyces leeuwenhoekii TaxID=1437453 RepID=UPI00141208DD|nr:hypothetical protein [Streptomyces leeuwenhoekii]